MPSCDSRVCDSSVRDSLVTVVDNLSRTADNWFRTFHNHIKFPENQTPWQGTNQPETLDSVARELESASTLERMSHNRDRHSGLSQQKHSTPQSLLRWSIWKGDLLRSPGQVGGDS